MGLPLTMVVLVVVFGPWLPQASLLLAGTAIVVSLGMTALVGHLFRVVLRMNVAPC
jgi:hypothetical protein